MNAPNFNLQKPLIDFEQVRDNRRSMPLWMDIDLSAARSIAAGSALLINIAGNSFYADADTTNVGFATVHFQDTNLGNSSAPFFVSPGFIAAVPYTQILIENAAQAGKRLRIFYGVDLDFQAGVNASLTVNGNTSTIPDSYTGSYKSQTLLAANTADQIFSAAANVNGAYVWRASGFMYNVNPGAVALIAKATAPVNTTDGDVIATTDQAGVSAAIVISSFRLERPVKIAAGKGLYMITSLAEATFANRSCIYTLL